MNMVLGIKNKFNKGDFLESYDTNALRKCAMVDGDQHKHFHFPSIQTMVDQPVRLAAEVDQEVAAAQLL